MPRKRSIRAGALSSAAGVLILAAPAGEAQDSVDVTFRYQASAVHSVVTVPGEFNGWNNSAWPMTNQGGELWTRTARLSIGGPPPPQTVPGAWQYKFYYPGASIWPNDPLNHHVNPAANDNSFLYVLDPTIYHLLPNQRTGTVPTGTPEISAYIFPKVGASIDTSRLSLRIDSTEYAGIGGLYDPDTRQFRFVVPASLADGTHTVVLRAASSAGGVNADTVTITTRSGVVQILSPPYRTHKVTYTTAGLILRPDGSGPDSSVTSATLSVNGAPKTIPVVNGEFADTTELQEGVNQIRVDAPGGSDSVEVTRVVNHAPTARALALPSGGSVTLSGSPSTDPDGQTITDYLWLDDPAHPLGLAGQTGQTVSVPKPGASGEYYYGLIVQDPDGNADTTRSYFIIAPNGSIDNPTYASNPAWAKSARIYFLFPKGASPEGTLAAAAQRLGRIKQLGFTVVWLMPIMKNAFPINNGVGPGYNIVDFYTVAPEYGTNQDFKDFVDEAHALELKVILDVTPNHTSRFHPWAENARELGALSPYWSWYEHTIIPHNTNGLGQSLDAYGFNYYSGFSDQLLNYNWTDIDARTEMIDVYRYWIQEFGIDGYRFDVYWGPHRRYGTASMGMPVREALKHVKPDILLLAEDSGTGFGTEVIFADYQSGGLRGGVDAAYDFALYFDAVRNFTFANPGAVSELHGKLDNGGFTPGPNSLMMRYMETQDEDRIYYLDPTPSSYYDPDPATAFARTMPMASVVFTAPGVPMIWNGQEVGWGYGITGGKLARSRSVVEWTFQGGPMLEPHYQRLASIRGAFPAFRQLKQDTNGDGRVDASDLPDFVRVISSNSIVYAFSRPHSDQNGLTAVNVSGLAQTSALDLSAANVLRFHTGIQPDTSYYLNDLYGGTTRQMLGSELGSVSVSLPPYGTAIFTVSKTRDTLRISDPITDVPAEQPLPQSFVLDQNFPNPFNPSTAIGFTLPAGGNVELRVFDLLGREVATVARGGLASGYHRLVWDGRNDGGMPVGSGVYIYRLTFSRDGGSTTALTRTMVLLK